MNGLKVKQIQIILTNNFNPYPWIPVATKRLTIITILIIVIIIVEVLEEEVSPMEQLFKDKPFSVFCTEEIKYEKDFF